MKMSFTKPECEVIRFGEENVITTSSCGCNVGGMDFGAGANGGPGCTDNTPHCECGSDLDQNCY